MSLKDMDLGSYQNECGSYMRFQRLYYETIEPKQDLRDHTRFCVEPTQLLMSISERHTKNV